MKESRLCILFRMAIKRKHNEVTLKTKYEELKELGKIDLTKKLAFSSTFLEVHFLLVANQSKYEELKELGKIDLTKKLAFSSTFLEVHFLLVANQSRSLPVE